MTSQAFVNNQIKAEEHLSSWKVGALFMEAGSGKTKVAHRLICQTDTDLVVWIGPLRTLDNAKAEIEKWGGLRVPVKYVGVESISQSARIYLNLHDELCLAKRAFIVVDESLKIKNLEAIRTQRVLELGRYAEYKLILNGTPLSRNLMDLYPQMQFLSPAILNMDVQQFKNTFCNYTQLKNGRGKVVKEFITSYENIDYLYSLIRNYVFECDLRLEIKQNWHEIHYSLGEIEREDYQNIKRFYLNADTMTEWNNNIFMAMTQSLQHCYCTSRAKVEAIREKVRSGEIDESKTIIFTKFIASHDLCSIEFPKAKVLSYQKEAFGLNLQEYTTTVYFDKTFDWALRYQASRRTFRVGQEQSCQYYDLTGNVGLERMIDRNIRNKVSMIDYFKSKTKKQIFEDL